MRLKPLLFAGALVPLAASAQEAARDLDYTFVEVNYVDMEHDAGPFDADGDGLELRGSLLLTDKVFLQAEYTSLDYAQGVDFTSYAIGAGVRFGLRPELDLTADVSWVNAEWDRRVAPDIDEDGFAFGVGLRARVHDAIEVDAGIRHVDLGDSDTYLKLAGRYYITENIAAGLGLTLNDDDTGWSIGLRAQFGR
ncbi:MAG: porin family protein [Gammaproteobacteria bacterium]